MTIIHSILYWDLCPGFCSLALLGSTYLGGCSYSYLSGGTMAMSVANMRAGKSYQDFSGFPNNGELEISTLN